MLRSDIIIVGGGVIGWSTAWHLKQIDSALDVLVVERDMGASNCASSRGAGGVRSQFGSAVNIEFSKYSIEQYRKFHEQFETSIGFENNGYVFVTRSDESASRLKDIQKFQQVHGVNIAHVEMSQIQEWSPGANFQEVTYASIGLTDGYLNGPNVRVAYQAAAVKLGVRYVEGVSIATLRGSSDQSLNCDVVILAGGHESAVLARSADIEIPVTPEQHWLASFPSYSLIRANSPMIVDFDSTFHYRPYGSGILVGYDVKECITTDQAFGVALRSACQSHLPQLFEFSENMKVWSGFYGVTPDRHAIIGRQEQNVICTGFCGHGVMHAPAAGICAAELAIHGKSKTLDATPLSHTRFSTGELLEEKMCI